MVIVDVDCDVADVVHDTAEVVRVIENSNSHVRSTEGPKDVLSQINTYIST